MNDFKKVLKLKNEFEAEVLEGILKEKNIPFELICYHDSAFDGIFQYQQGWGHLETSDEFVEEIKGIYKDIQNTITEEKN
ncbi:MAG: hypothetical protein K8S23_11660 [Candidatus Cloacimonetes bacterium]|nr:hypothetical protein [Candidatus Cloacimonadota bacterium]